MYKLVIMVAAATFLVQSARHARAQDPGARGGGGVGAGTTEDGIDGVPRIRAGVAAADGVVGEGPAGRGDLRSGQRSEFLLVVALTI